MKHLVYWIIQTLHFTRVEKRPEASIHTNKSTGCTRRRFKFWIQPPTWIQQYICGANCAQQMPLQPDRFGANLLHLMMTVFRCVPCLISSLFSNSFVSFSELDETPWMLQKVWKAMLGQWTFSRDYAESHQSALMTGLKFELFWIQTLPQGAHIMGCKHIIFLHKTKTF